LNKRPSILTARRSLFMSLLVIGIAAYLLLGLKIGDLNPGEGGIKLAKRFFSAALSPAMTNEQASAFTSKTPLWKNALSACWETIRISAAAVSLSLVIGLIFGFLGATAWWRNRSGGIRNPLYRFVLRFIAPVVYSTTRVLITFTRSVHELLWATLFLAALGMGPLAAVFALTIPFSGTFAKIFSEMIDEADPSAARALELAGAGPLQVFCFALLPEALPDMIAYTLYRFECGLRSSAVMGFMGVLTLGYYIDASFENRHYHEVWTYLYALIALIVFFEKWSDAIRRRLVEGPT
jgi:phosphonate transport system permease protein